MSYLQRLAAELIDEYGSPVDVKEWHAEIIECKRTDRGVWGMTVHRTYMDHAVALMSSMDSVSGHAGPQHMFFEKHFAELLYHIFAHRADIAIWAEEVDFFAPNGHDWEAVVHGRYLTEATSILESIRHVTDV